MITGSEDMQATALRAKGWTISAIARHLDLNRETVRNHLNGTVVPGERRRSEPDPIDWYVPYIRERLAEDPHLWASALFDEVVELGFALSYQSFTRGLRSRSLRPHCEACDGVKGRATIEIDHPPGEEIQWDWVELPDAPWGGDAHLLIGSLPCSGRFRGAFAELETQPYLVQAMDMVLRRLGGTAGLWRVDRMSTVVDPKTGIVQNSFVPVAKHYAAKVVACPPRRGNRKGSVEKSIDYSTQRFWRTMAANTMAESQAKFDVFCEKKADQRARPFAQLAGMIGREEAAEFLAAAGRRRPTVADIAALEKLRPLPASCYPATLEAENTVGPSALVHFEGNAYSVPLGLNGHVVKAQHRLGSQSVEILSASGLLLATHRREVPGGGFVVRDPAHRAALEHRVLAAFTDKPPCKRKANRPPGDKAKAEAAKLRRGAEDRDVVVSLESYAELADDMARQRREAGQ
jgi:transposase